MSAYVVKILETQYITHDVKQFVVEKPKGYTFNPGQATDVAINLPEWKKELRPFTFTSLNVWDHLEFTIKIYPERNGVTHQLGKTNAGAELIIHQPFGAIQYKGPGVFLAGGAGITPFIAILRQLALNNQINGNALICSNKYAEDVIMDEELRKMLGNNYMSLLTRENLIGFGERRISRDFLVENIRDFGQNFYICGPDKFVEDINAMLIDLGANPEFLIFEK